MGELGTWQDIIKTAENLGSAEKLLAEFYNKHLKSLALLYDERPALLFGDEIISDAQKKDLKNQLTTYAHGVGAYLRDFGDEPSADYDDERWGDKEQLVKYGAEIRGSVVESLWDIVAGGRELVADIAEENTERLNKYLSEYREDMENGFEKTEDALRGAIDRLSADEQE